MTVGPCPPAGPQSPKGKQVTVSPSPGAALAGLASPPRGSSQDAARLHSGTEVAMEISFSFASFSTPEDSLCLSFQVIKDQTRVSLEWAGLQDSEGGSGQASVFSSKSPAARQQGIIKIKIIE